jgi:hypothetical protein
LLSLNEHSPLSSQLIAQIHKRYDIAPERFTKGRPTVKVPPAEVFINPVPADADQATIEKGVNFPTLQRAIGNAP